MPYARTTAPAGRPDRAACYYCAATIPAEEETTLLLESPDHEPEMMPAARAAERSWMGVLGEDGQKALILIFVCDACAPAFSDLEECAGDEQEWVN